MKILMFSNTFPPGYTGGAEVSNYHTLRGLITRGHDVALSVFNTRQETAVDKWYSLNGVPVHRRYWKPLSGFRTAVTDVLDWRVYNAARRDIRTLQPDVVHLTNVSGSSLAPFLAVSKEGRPSVAMLHDLWLLCPNNMRYQHDGAFCSPDMFGAGCGRCLKKYDYWGAVPGRLRLFKRLTAFVRFFLSPSQALIDRHVELGYERGRFLKVPYGVEFDTSSAICEPAARPLTQRSAGVRTIVFAGGGIEIKGARVVAEAIPRVLGRLADIRFIIAGGGDLTHLFDHGSPNIHMLDRIPFSDMKRLFSVSDLALVPSVWHENLPVVIFEAFQHGVPVIGANIGGIPELVRPGVTGDLFEAGNSGDLAQKIIAFFEREADSIRRIRHACVRSITTGFSYSEHMDKIEDAYRRAISGS